jgi:hypothetical protein
MHYNTLGQIMAKIRSQEKQEGMKILRDLRLKLQSHG